MSRETRVASIEFSKRTAKHAASTGNVSSKINQTLGLVRFIQHYVACVCVCVCVNHQKRCKTSKFAGNLKRSNTSFLGSFFYFGFVMVSQFSQGDLGRLAWPGPITTFVLCKTLHHTAFLYITMHCSAFLYITLQCISLHCNTLRYIELQ